MIFVLNFITVFLQFSIPEVREVKKVQINHLHIRLEDQLESEQYFLRY